jgi:hypothetical protein
MTGREIREALLHAGVLPSKQLGQNFLIDPNMARWIVSQLEVTADDAVVEVGPGTASLSEHLVGKVRRLILIEFDTRLADALKHRFRDEPSVEVHQADGAKFDGRTLFKHRPLKFLGNNPLFPALRSDPMALSAASRNKQIPSSPMVDSRHRCRSTSTDLCYFHCAPAIANLAFNKKVIAPQIDVCLSSVKGRA